MFKRTPLKHQAAWSLEVFKTITCDNGCENLDFKGMEKGGRTKVFYAHPYSARERGTNENINRMIRRFVPKGEDIGKYAKAEIKRIQDWINNYPRRILGGLTYAAFKKYEGIMDGLIRRMNLPWGGHLKLQFST